jgi:hypothetical protein
MNAWTKTHPVFRLRELGPEFRTDFSGTLKDQMHRRFDAVAQEQIPGEIAAVLQKLSAKSDGGRD